jgi:hypothetical protein
MGKCCIKKHDGNSNQEGKDKSWASVSTNSIRTGIRNVIYVENCYGVGVEPFRKLFHRINRKNIL